MWVLCCCLTLSIGFMGRFCPSLQPHSAPSTASHHPPSSPGAALVALSKRPRFRWVVYDAPATPPPLVAAAGAPAGWLGSLTACCPFNPSLQFLDR